MTSLTLDAVTCWQLTQSLWRTCWVGLVVGVVAAAANRCLARAPAWQRYWLNGTALAVLGACLPISFSVIRAAADAPATRPSVAAMHAATPIRNSANNAREAITGLASAAVPDPEDSAIQTSKPSSPSDTKTDAQFGPDYGHVVLLPSVERLVQAAAPWITGAYLVGFYAMLLKLIAAIYGGKRLRAGCRPVADRDVLDMLARQSQRLALRFVPVLACCERVAVPVVVGVIRPMILTPAGMLTGLAPDELSAVFTHELAHIRRYDHWLILVQRFLEAVLFFHPVAWYLTRQIHTERERCCDDLVVAAGGDRLVYARTLLHVAELRLLGTRQDRRLTALAADGQRPSQLRQRIFRLLGESTDSHVRIRNRWPALVLGILGAAGLWIVTGSAWQLLAQTGNDDQASSNTSTVENSVTPARGDDRTEPLALAVADNDKNEVGTAPGMTLPSIAERGAKNFEAIKTAHIKFRCFNWGSPFKAGTTPERCRELLKNHDLTQGPNELHELINEISDDEKLRTPRPWSDCEVYVAGRKVRESRQSSGRAPDIHITDGQVALRWNEANSQVNIDAAGQSRIYQMGLRDFWQPFQDGNQPERTVGHSGSEVIISSVFPQRGANQLVVHAWTGFWLSSTQQKLGKVTGERRWLNWRTGAAGIPYPAVVVEFDFQDEQLVRSGISVVDEMRLNEPLPETIFQLGAPAGSTIFDSRDTALISGGRINHDVFDVTSAEQLKEAAKPLDPEPKTPQEKFAVAELKRLYALADDEVLKRIGPPYPASRKHLPKLLGERYMSARRAIRSDCIAWQDGKLGDSWPFAGGSYTFQMLITHLLKLKPTEIEGDSALLKREIPGDFVHRIGASSERLAESLAEIAGLEFQDSIRLTFREVERPVYVARGELKLALAEGQKTVALNGGPHAGDHGEGISFGDLAKLLQDVAAYIHVPVINETQAASDQLTWSSRWYDLPTAKAEKRFKIDPQVVLRQITEQTGITFTAERRTVRLLFVETDGL